MSDMLTNTMKRAVAVLRGAGLWWGIGLSVALAVASLAVAIAIVLGWSVDHFKRAGGAPFWVDRHPAIRAFGIVGKNVAGVVLIVLGLVMALPGIPGQGILTVVIGVTLLDFPGKRGLERRLIRRPYILRMLNRLRRRFHRPALELD